jgi:hypothetical protein
MIRYFYRIEVHPIWQSLLSCPFLQLEVVHGDKCLKVLVRPEVLGTKRRMERRTRTSRPLHRTHTTSPASGSSPSEELE